jgi:hypothetical protein
MREFEILGSELVLVVEDSLSRVEWMKKRFPHAKVFVNSERAMEWLRTNQPSWIFLDYDGEKPGQTFEPVARSFAEKSFSGHVIVDSVNPFSVELIRKILQDAGVAVEVCPFGMFSVRTRE